VIHSSQTFPWIVSATEAKPLIARGATVLDTRHILQWLLGHVPGSICLRWQQFSQSQSPNKGKLIDDREILQNKLRAIAIRNDKPVLVVGNPADACHFGEEGRIVWMLRTLGHPAAAFVDGGYPALREADIPTTLEITQPEPGDFVVNPTATWTIAGEELRRKLAFEEEPPTLIDTRSPREYAGTPVYGEKRGGHVPGAIHFHFKDLLDERGYLRPQEDILQQLQNLGIDRNTPVVTYCTGGVRSAFFTSVLTDLGFPDAKNYPGSMWEWAAAPAADYPLEAKH
jgi:thiosulfate/3-mercaptopyruvate sulfurtransferase